MKSEHPMDIEELTRRAMSIRTRYADLEHKRYGRSWTREEITLGFVGDVGDLAKLMLAIEGVRSIPDAPERLAHELADCLWSILVLAKLSEVDLEQAFLATMDTLRIHIDADS
jgi:NTP pyrophosphatase (non-canonical NTP hydrolase)